MIPRPSFPSPSKHGSWGCSSLTSQVVLVTILMLNCTLLLLILHAPGLGPISRSNAGCDHTPVTYITQDTASALPLSRKLDSSSPRSAMATAEEGESTRLVQLSQPPPSPTTSITTAPLPPPGGGGADASRERNVIAVLTDSFDEGLVKLFRNVDLFFEDNSTTSFLIFHTGYPTGAEQLMLQQSTKRQVNYYNVDQQFSTFPPGFDPFKEENKFQRRGKWNYQMMCRFWFKSVFELPVLHDVKYLMRLDVDSRLTGPWRGVFETMDERQANYWANKVIYDVEWVVPGVVQLKEFAEAYYRDHNLTAANMDVWIHTFAEQGQSIRAYFNNFEINRVSFYHRPEVQAWIQAVEDSWGIYRYRWGDAPLRHLTLAFFARNPEVLEVDYAYKLPYCHPWPHVCPQID